MIQVPTSIFLNAWGALCTSGAMSGRVTVDLSSEEAAFGSRELTRNLHTVTVLAQDFPQAQEGTEFTIGGSVYKALKPPQVDQDALIFTCKRK